MKTSSFIRVAAVLLLFVSSGLRASADEPSRRERRKWASEADALIGKKDFAGAAHLLEKAASPGAAKSDLAVWNSKLGRCYELTRNYQKALAAYQEAYQLNPKGLDQMLDLARVYDLVDLKENAIDLFQKILLKDKSRKDVVFALANLYMRSNNLSQAREYTKKALDGDPQDHGAQRLMASIEEAEGDLAAAAHRWEGLLATRPSAEDSLRLGRLWAAQNEYDLAEMSFRKALEQGAARADVSFQRGVLSWRRGLLVDADKFWKEADRNRPGWDAVKFFLALLRQGKGDGDQAIYLMKDAQACATSDYIKGLASDFLEITGSTSTVNALALPANRSKGK